MLIFKTQVLSGAMCVPQEKLSFQTGGKWVLPGYLVDAAHRAQANTAIKSQAIPGSAETGGVAVQTIQTQESILNIYKWVVSF